MDEREREAAERVHGAEAERPGRPSAGRGGGTGEGSGADLELTAELVEEVLRTALALEDVISGLLAELPPRAFPGEDPGRVLMEMIVTSSARLDLPAVNWR